MAQITLYGAQFARLTFDNKRLSHQAKSFDSCEALFEMDDRAYTQILQPDLPYRQVVVARPETYLLLYCLHYGTEAELAISSWS